MPNYSFSSSFGFALSSSTSSQDGQIQASGRAYRKEYRSDPSGTSTRVTTQRLGERPVQEVRYYDAFGRELLGDGTRPEEAERDRRQVESGRIEDCKVEDVTDGEAGKGREVEADKCNEK